MAYKPREAGETEMIVLNALYLVRSTVSARIWDDSGVEFPFTVTYQESIAVV
jgi:hypothetical protein